MFLEAHEVLICYAEHTDSHDGDTWMTSCAVRGPIRHAGEAWYQLEHHEPADTVRVFIMDENTGQTRDARSDVAFAIADEYLDDDGEWVSGTPEFVMNAERQGVIAAVMEDRAGCDNSEHRTY